MSLGSQISFFLSLRVKFLLKTDSGYVGRKGRMSSMTDRYGGGILDGHRDR